MKHALLIGLLLLPVFASAESLNLAPDTLLPLPAGTHVLPHIATGLTQIELTLATKRRAHVQVTAETRRSEQEAVDRLVDIAREFVGKRTFVQICGWPALERLYTRQLPQLMAKGAEESDAPSPTVYAVTVAVAQANTLIRFEALLPPAADQAQSSAVFALAHSLKCPINPHSDSVEDTIGRLSQQLSGKAPNLTAPAARLVRSESVPPPQAPDRFRTPAGGALASIQTAAGPVWSEIQLAASADGKVVVVGSNGGTSFSTDYGDSFSASSVATPFNKGDPTLATGASGTFYLGGIDVNSAGCTDPVDVSSNGATFTFAGNGAFCATTSSSLCFPDQPQIAADSKNSATLGDQVYMVWRNFTKGWWETASTCGGLRNGPNAPAASCSSDSGKTWSAPTVLSSGDFGRITTGSDGFAYITTVSGSNIMLYKFSACSSGFALQAGFPVTVATDLGIDCPVDGLDRCDAASTASAHAAVSIDFPSSIYVAYAAKSSGTNDNIVVRHSIDGGLTWAERVNANSTATGHRFLPWICGNANGASIGWYDRRAATATDDSLTSYFFNSSTGSAVGAEMNISGSTDSQKTATAPCCPKYGDYNGNVCTRDRTFVAWASATPPAGVKPPTSGIDVFVEAVPPGPPMMTALSPGAVTCGVATPITISGANFRGVTAVTVDSAYNNGQAPVSVTSFTVNSSSSITATVPGSLGGGFYEVVVHTASGSSVQPVLSARTDLLGVPPIVSSVNPSSGPTGGGSLVTIDGSCFNRTTSFTFGSAVASGAHCISATRCTVYSPASSTAGNVDVTAKTDGLASVNSSSDLFSYSGVAITRVQPGSGPITGGTQLTISGSGFPSWTPSLAQNTPMTIGGMPVIGQCDRTWCFVTTPAVSTPGLTHVIARAFGASSASSAGSEFVYTPSPMLIRFETPSTWSGTIAVVGLDGNAPAAGSVVAVSSSDPTLVTVAPSVTISGGTTTGVLPVTVNPSPTNRAVVLSANYAGAALSSTVQVMASPAVSLSIGATALNVNESAPVTVSINSPAPAGGTQITMSSSAPSTVLVPSPVTIPAGAYATSFSITDHYVSGPSSVTISARRNGTTVSDSVIVYTPPSRCPTPTQVCKAPLHAWNPNTCKCELAVIPH